MNALVGRGKQFFQTQFTRGAAKAAGVRQPKQLDACVIHKLQQVFSIEGKQRRVHHFENARQQCRSLKRAHALFLQQIGKRVHLRCQFAECVVRAGSAGTEGVVALA